MDSFESAQDTLMTSLNSSLNVVLESRKELGGQDEEPETLKSMPERVSSSILLTIPTEKVVGPAGIEPATSAL